MTEHDAFLADILENPEDDAPRLIYADWLDERGESERAEFIRVQCALAREPLDHPDYPRWQQREAQLQPRAYSWAGPLTEWCVQCVFRRGFIEMIEIEASTFLSRAQEIIDFAPVRSVKLLHLYAEHLAPLARLSSLQRITVLQASGRYRHSGCQKLFSSPYLRHLVGLAVHDTPIGLSGLSALLESPSISGLTHLNLGATGIGLEGVHRLSLSAKSQHLLALDLRGNGLGSAALRALDRSPYLRRLQRLGMWFNQLGDEGLLELLSLPLFARLRHLSIGNNRFTSRGLHALAESAALSGLRTLWLGVDPFSEAGIEALFHSRYLHPELRLGIWLHSGLSEEIKQEGHRLFGDRISFDHPGEMWESDPAVGWPLWQV